MLLDPTILRDEFRQATSSRVLGLSISLTEQCNFRCTYCYEPFEMKRMTSEVFDRLKRFVANTMPHLKRFELRWFGGEPLLEWRRAVEFTAYSMRLADAHAVATVPASMPTNAWSLTPQVAKELTQAGVGLFMVSLDGSRETHNRTRRTIAGRGTFDRVYKNLLALKHSDLRARILLRLHLHEDNLDSQRALAIDLVNDFGADERFAFEPVGLGNFGGPTVHTLKLLDRTRVEQVATALWEDLKMPRRTSVGAERVCYAAKRSHIFIRPDGNAYKCTSAPNRRDNLVGSLTHDGHLKLDEGAVSDWAFGFETGDSEDLSCPLKTKDREHVIRFVYKDRRPRASANGKRCYGS